MRTISDYTGRGPTKARTYINDNVVTVVLHDTLTTGERSLISDDLDAVVLATRKAFQGTMRHELIADVEKILGRTVAALRFRVASHRENHGWPSSAARPLGHKSPLTPAPRPA